MQIYTVSRDGGIFVWKPKSQEDGIEPKSTEEVKGWTLHQRHLHFEHGKISSCAFHAPSSILVLGFSSGVFGLFELPELNMIHSLSISKHKIDTVAINSTGEWLAFGCATLGQLLVWEWQSESYVLKQQGHFYDLNSVAYAQDGQIIATGGDDGKVKLWNSVSGFCFITFKDHSAGVEAVQFCKNGQVLLSASRDGTVRAYDMIRYRNFRSEIFLF